MPKIRSVTVLPALPETLKDLEIIAKNFQNLVILCIVGTFLDTSYCPNPVDVEGTP